MTSPSGVSKVVSDRSATTAAACGPFDVLMCTTAETTRVDDLMQLLLKTSTQTSSKSAHSTQHYRSPFKKVRHLVTKVMTSDHFDFLFFI